MLREISTQDLWCEQGIWAALPLASKTRADHVTGVFLGMVVCLDDAYKFEVYACGSRNECSVGIQATGVSIYK